MSYVKYVITLTLNEFNYSSKSSLDWKEQKHFSNENYSSMTKFMVQLVQLRQVQRTKNTLYSEHANQNSDCLKITSAFQFNFQPSSAQFYCGNL